MKNSVSLIGDDVDVIFQVIEYTVVLCLSQLNFARLPLDPGSRPDCYRDLAVMTFFIDEESAIGELVQFLQTKIDLSSRTLIRDPEEVAEN